MRRGQVILFLGMVWIAAHACSPLRELESYSRGQGGAPFQGAGGSLGGEPSLGGGGVGGFAGEGQREVCGDGETNPGEECDAAGNAEECTSSCRVPPCPAGCECSFGLGSHWAYCGRQLSWLDAKAVCDAAGMRLAYPRDERENAYLRALAARAGVSSSWIGATDAIEDGEWRDISGTLFWRGQALGESVSEGFEKWSTGEPNNWGGDQDCAILWPNTTWDDAACEGLVSFTCQLSPETPETCGNGRLDVGEACDEGEASLRCDPDCTAVRCGDGLVRLDLGEECDDGNLVESDRCTSACRFTGLVAHYPLTEKFGALAFEVGAYEDLALVRGGASFSSGALGIVLNGSSQYLEVPVGRSPQIVGPITMMMLFRPALPFAAGVHDLISKNDTGVAENWLRLNGAWLQAGAWSSQGESATSFDLTAFVKQEVFHHLAARYDGKRWSVFLDGEVRSTSLSEQGALDLDAAYLFGGRPDAGGRFFEGAIRSVRLYERALNYDEILELAEHDLGEVQSVARGKLASQSSLYAAGTADLAVDGKVDGLWSSGSVTHTQPEISPYWQVDLKGPHCLSHVVLHDRTDECCTERLRSGVIELSMDGETYEPMAAFSDPVGRNQGFSFPEVTARIVRVRLNDLGSARILSLAEVEVFGKPGACPADAP